MKQWKDITPRKITDDYDIKPPIPYQVKYSKPKKPDSMFKKIWKFTKKVVTKTVWPIVSNEIAIKDLIRKADFVLKTRDDANGKREAYAAILFMGEVIIEKAIEL